MPVVLPPSRFDNATDGLLASVAQGDILYRGATLWNNLPASTAGFVLTTNGPGANPSWAAASGSLTGAVILAPAAVNRNLVQPTADANKGLVIRGFSPTQSANLQEWQLSTGANAALVGPTGDFSCPGTTAQSERFGLGSAAGGGLAATACGYFATASGAGALSLGSSAQAMSANAIAVGAGALANANNTFAFGGSALANASAAIAIGVGAQATDASAYCIGSSSVVSGNSAIGIGVGLTNSGGRTVLIGASAAATGTDGVGIGRTCTVGHNSCVALGRDATTTANNQFIAGANTGFFISQVYFGSGPVSATPTAYALNGSGGSGANIAGANLTLAGGQSTGSAKGGDLLIQTAPAGIAGSGLNPLATLAQFTGDSKIGLFGVTPMGRQTGGAATAGAAYTATEQGMINRMYTALQAYGWLT